MCTCELCVVYVRMYTFVCIMYNVYLLMTHIMIFFVVKKKRNHEIKNSINNNGCGKIGKKVKSSLSMNLKSSKQISCMPPFFRNGKV